MDAIETTHRIPTLGSTISADDASVFGLGTHSGTLRVMTYNVRSCRGFDGRLRPDRILSVVESAAPEVVALQELDVGQSRSHLLDQAAFLAEGLRMDFHFVAARACHGGHYGNAILSKMPIVDYRSAALPQLDSACEPRAVQRVRLEARFGLLDVVNVHLGLSRQERRLQVEKLFADLWLSIPEGAKYLLLCGDLNASPGSFVYRRLAAPFRDAQARRARPTFPALFPLFRIDHIFVDPGIHVRSSEVVTSPLSRIASDHRPLIALIEAGADA